MSITGNIISVVIPVYNSESRLDICIESIIRQTYTDWELILVDDGSKDNSLNICKKYSEKDNRVKVISQKNAGVSSARNTGIEHCSGDYICFVDSDDEIEPNMLSILMNTLSKTNAELVICGYTKTGKVSKEYTLNSKVLNGHESIVRFVCENYTNWSVNVPWGKLYRKTLIRGVNFNPTYTLGEDLDFNIGIFRQCQIVALIPDALYIYNDSTGSLTKTYKKGNYEAISKIYCKTMDYVSNYLPLGQVEQEKICQEIYKKMYFFGISFMSQNLSTSAFGEEMLFIRNICSDPFYQMANSKLIHKGLIDKIYSFAIRRYCIGLLYVLSFVKNILIDSRH